MIRDLVSTQKEKLRSEFRAKRQRLPLERREEAHLKGTELLWSLCQSNRYVLSYASFGDEFATGQLNQKLAAAGKLILPAVSGDKLRFFHVHDLSTTLSPSQWGVEEPIAEKCQEADPATIVVALVPGLAFDRFGHRLGYGKGYYDRFFAQHPSCIGLGVGYNEQFHSVELPTLPSDKALQHIYLF